MASSNSCVTLIAIFIFYKSVAEIWGESLHPHIFTHIFRDVNGESCLNIREAGRAATSPSLNMHCCQGGSENYREISLTAPVKDDDNMFWL